MTTINRRGALAMLAAAGMSAARPGAAWEFWTTPKPKIDAQALRAAALRAVVAIDVSGSSPAFDPGFMGEAWRVIEPQLRRRLQLFDELVLLRVGDPARADGMWRTAIQQRIDRGGMPRDHALRMARGQLAGIQRGREEHDESALVAGLRDCVALLNPTPRAPQVIFYVTDGIERSKRDAPLRVGASDKDGAAARGALGYAIDCLAAPSCELGALRVKVPAGTQVWMLGIGLGVDAPRQQMVKQAWGNLLVTAGFAPADIRLLTRF